MKATESAPAHSDPIPVTDELRALNRQLTKQTELLQTTLASISQGIFMIDIDGRVRTFNRRACELLDLPESLFASAPTLGELTRYQLERGDFGDGVGRVPSHARAYVAAGGKGVIPQHYLRSTHTGRTLEVKTHELPNGGMVRTFTDVTDYVQADADRQRLNLLVNATHAIALIGGWDADIANDKDYWTEGMYRILETTPEQCSPGPATRGRFFTAQARALIKASYADVVNQPKTHDLEFEMITAKGRRIWVHSMGSTTWENGRAVRRTAMLQDITERKRAESAWRENEQRWKLALESTGDGVWDWHIQTGQEFYSKRLLEMYGYGEDELQPDPDELDSRTHPDDRAQLERNRQEHFDGIAPTYSNEHRILCKDGSWKWILSRGMVIDRDAQGEPLRMIGTHTDISVRKKSHEVIWRQAHFDALTGLPNRGTMRERLEHEIKRRKREAQHLAVLFIDLDHFKEVNDTLGHDQGDLLLIETARRLRACVREADTVARMGGDEFTVILTELNDMQDTERILQKLLQALQVGFELGTEQVFVTASIGVTLYPTDATNIDDLFKNADQALYVAKEAGRNCFSFFTPALQEAAQTRLHLVNDLRSSLASDQFDMVYQPVIQLATGAIVMAAADLVWRHPQRGLVERAVFAPIAETSGLIVDIGNWAFVQAARQVKAWRVMLGGDFRISLGKSPVQFRQSGQTHESWVRQLQAMGLPGAAVVVEVAEALLHDSTGAVEQLLEMHDAGLGISLDDFGTGYSSLAFLQRFDIDFIKISASFVRHLIAGSTDLALCKAITVMAHELGIQVIAEGVESEQQRELLAAAGCDYGQGPLFAPPLPASEFGRFVKERLRAGPGSTS